MIQIKNNINTAGIAIKKNKPTKHSKNNANTPKNPESLITFRVFDLIPTRRHQNYGSYKSNISIYSDL